MKKLLFVLTLAAIFTACSNRHESDYPNPVNSNLNIGGCTYALTIEDDDNGSLIHSPVCENAYHTQGPVITGYDTAHITWTPTDGGYLYQLK